MCYVIPRKESMVSSGGIEFAGKEWVLERVGGDQVTEENFGDDACICSLS